MTPRTRPAAAVTAAAAVLAALLPAATASAAPAPSPGASAAPTTPATPSTLPTPGATATPGTPGAPGVTETPTPSPTPTVTGVPKPPLAPPVADPAGPPLPALPPTPAFPAWIDDFARYEPQAQCRTTAQPGTLALRDLLAATYGLSSFSILRPCGGAISEHHDGRAIDIMLKASDPTQLATANAILGWLLGPDAWGNQAAVARRLGVMYVIFNHYMWRAYRPDAGWLPYSGGESHADHIHVSLSTAGAAELTSWWSLDPMTIAGVHLLGTRWWRVSCSPVVMAGSRCTAEIKASHPVWSVTRKRYVPVLGWVFNRTTTVATESPAWDAAATGHTGDSTTTRGAALHTVCTAEAPSPRVCTTSQLSNVVVAAADPVTQRTNYSVQQRWVLRAVVQLLVPAAPAAPAPSTATPAPAPLRRR